MSEVAETSANARRPWLLAVAAWSLIAVALGVVQVLARWSHVNEDPWSAPALLGGWLQFDGPEYLEIADQGYHGRQLVWFPMYPLLIRAVSVVVGDPLAAAVMVTLVAGISGAACYWRWLEMSVPAGRARIGAFLGLLLYPYAWFVYGAVYPTSLYLLCVVGSFALVERRHLVSAGVVAAIGTAARPSGFALAVGVMVLALERDGVIVVRSGAGGWAEALRLPTRLRLDRAARRHVGPALAWLGLVFYCVYLWLAWGDPLRFVAEQQRYHDSGPMSLLKRQYFDAWYAGFDGRHLGTTTLQALLLVGVVASVPAVGRRFGWGYGVFVALVALLPAVSVATFMGTGRYLVAAFPVWALAGERLARSRWWAVYLALASSVMVVMVFGFARAWYLS